MRTLLTPSQAQWFGLLSSVLLWVAITGREWSGYSGKSQVMLMAWTIILGIAGQLFNLVWLSLGVRVAAAVDPLKAAGTFFGASVGTFLGGIGALVVLVYLLSGVDLQPTLPLFGLIYFFVITLLVLPPALAVLGGAALGTHFLASRGGTPRAGGSNNDGA